MREFVPVLGFFGLLLVPFIVSIFQKNAAVKWMALGCSAASVLLGWQDYWWMLPWLAGMALVVMRGNPVDANR